MSWFRITLHRSAIGLPKRTRGVLMALGLRRRNQTVFHPVEAQFAGMILKVKELVLVDEVAAPLTPAEVKAERTPDAGFYVETRGPAPASQVALLATPVVSGFGRLPPRAAGSIGDFASEVAKATGRKVRL
ncbi:ribosomal protein L30p/L7e-domain-containing protein [Lasiosphaeria miniovina]|uniref:Large ribosomal subunit protein uL30m n=1 Tax=Lasiosphaeria miniovina TaxID=1954250 RepID=A0AA39ZZ84_9PEZI|nr:ribosomal protein L30p/L7e-domain-containing protein [Lasiosphaeria miniovina]KAK0706376.1 ribosomal protein L30p/L7e-domain-containing protein [Lasiosphaeria miniovina]